MRIRVRAALAALLSSALLSQFVSPSLADAARHSAFAEVAAARFHAGTHVRATTIALAVPPRRIPIPEPQRPRTTMARPDTVRPTHAPFVRPLNARRLDGPPMLRPSQIDAAIQAARNGGRAAMPSPLGRTRLLSPVPRSASAPVRRSPAGTVPASVQRATQSTPSSPTDSGTGINPWWRYQEQNVPGGGHVMVNVGTGNLVLQDDDMTVPHKGIAMTFRRTYNSQMPATISGFYTNWQSLYGNGWTNTFDAHIVATSSTQKSVYDIDGARYDYVSNGNGYTSLTPGQHAILQWDGACGMLWSKKNGTVYYFYISNPQGSCPALSSIGGYAGRVYQIVGRNRNNYITFSYAWDNGDASAAGKINTITATTESGMTSTLSFGDVNGRRVLQTLTMPDSATNVQYWYDASGNLVNVSRPANNSAGARPMVAYGYQTIGADTILKYAASPRWCQGSSSGCGYDGSWLYAGFSGTSAATSTVSVMFDAVTVNPTINDGTNVPLIANYSPDGLNYTGFNQYYTTGVTTPTYRDTDGHMTNWVVDGSGRPTQTQECTASTNQGQQCTGTWLVTNESWDTDNNLASEVDPRGYETDYAHDANGNTIAVAQPTTTTYSQGTFRPTALYSYDIFDNVTAYCDPNATHQLGGDWGTTAPTGDSLCPITNSLATRFVWSTDPTQSGSPSPAGSPSWEPYGELQARIGPGTAAAPSGYRINFTYDPSRQGGTDFGLPTTVQAASAIAQVDGSSRQPVQNFWYDANGNVGCYDKGNGQWLLAYDALGRTTSAADPDDSAAGSGICGKSSGTSGWSTARTTTYFADGKVSGIQSASQRSAGISTAFTYDLDGNETSETHHYGCTSASSCSAGMTQKWYDGQDRLVEVSLPSDKWDIQQYPMLTRYIYDVSRGGTTPYQGTALAAYGNLVKTQEMLSGAVITPFTAATESSFAGLPITSGSWLDIRATTFDALDRALAQYEAAFASQPKVSNTYDGVAPTGGTPQLGLLSSVVLATSESKQYTYDELGRATDVSYANDGSSTSPKHVRYDASGHVASQGTDALGMETFLYDNAGERLSTTKPASLGGVIIGYDYYPDGMRQDLTFSSSAFSANPLYQFAYRADGRRTNLTLSNGGRFSWTYSAAGRLQAQTDPFTGTSISPDNSYTNAKGLPIGHYYPTAMTYQPETYSYDSFGRNLSVTLPPGVFSQSAGGFDLEDGAQSFTATSVQNPATTSSGMCATSNIRNEKLLWNGALNVCGGYFYNGASFDIIPSGAIGAAGPPTGAIAPWTLDARAGMLLSWQSGTLSDGNVSSRRFTYDASGRITSDVANVDRPAVQTDPYNNGTRLIFTGSRTKSYDAENRLHSQQTTRDMGMGPLVNGSQATDSGGYFTDIGSPSNWQLQSVDYSADDHPSRLNTVQNIGTPDGTTPDAWQFRWLWDGGDLLAQCSYDSTYNSQCGAWSFSVEGLADYMPTSPNGTLLVNDRGISGQIVSNHDGHAFGGMKMLGRATRAWNTGVSAVIAPPSSDGCPCTVVGALAEKVTPDGWSFDNNTWQGVRTMDASIGTWTTPDAYAGNVHDPMSQKPFMWNHNNPYQYADPSGYCVEDACVGEAAVAVGVAEGVAEGAELLGDAELAGAIRGGISTAQRSAAQAFERLGGWTQGRFQAARGNLRIADHLDWTRKVLGEAKNVKYQHLSSQLKDQIAFAKANGLTYILRIREDTQLSKPLQDTMNELIKAGVGVIERISK